MGEGGKAGKVGLENEFFKFQQTGKVLPQTHPGAGFSLLRTPSSPGGFQAHSSPCSVCTKRIPRAQAVTGALCPPKHPGTAHLGSHTPILLSPHPKGRALPGHGMCLLTPCSPGSRGERPESCRNSLVPGSEGEQTLETEKSRC